jgi:prefoldin subunit 2
VEKLSDLESQSEEHIVVIERLLLLPVLILTSSLKPMPSDRKCFRMIGGVLVERTVGEILPALEETQAGV